MLKSLYDNIIEVNYENTILLEKVLIYYMTLIEMNNDFKKRLTEAYAKNSQ